MGKIHKDQFVVPEIPWHKEKDMEIKHLRLDEVMDAIGFAWDKKTAYGWGKRWTIERPEVDQCAVTALVLQDYFGGKLLRCETDVGSHYWNEFENGIQFDATVKQFEYTGEVPDRSTVITRPRSYLLKNRDTAERYIILKKRVDTIIEKWYS